MRIFVSISMYCLTALQYVIKLVTMVVMFLSTHPLVVVPGAQLTDRQSVVSVVPVFADRWQHHAVTKRGKISLFTTKLKGRISSNLGKDRANTSWCDE